jgi:hypothetical protein
MIGTEESTTNFPGKPSWMDELKDEVVDENAEKQGV